MKFEVVGIETVFRYSYAYSTVALSMVSFFYTEIAAASTLT